jgi:hypothetical protein
VAARDGGGCGAGCECDDDLDCSAGVPSCVESRCVEGSCFYRARDSMCGPGRVCDMAIGCTMADAGAGGDGGSIDDAGTSTDAEMGIDASEGDAGGTLDAGDAGGAIDASVAFDGGDVRDAGGALDGSGSFDGGDAGGALDAGSLRPIGSACTSDVQCQGIGDRPGLCAMRTEGGIFFPGGYCTVRCDRLMRDCGPDAVCVLSSLSSTGLCMDRCSDDRECRTAEGYRCARPPRAFEPVLVCMPRGFP